MENDKKEKTYQPSVEDVETIKNLDRRILEMKDYRKNLGIEKEWREADAEYVSTKIQMEGKKRFEQDQDTGLRSRMVKITGDEDEWRSDISDPTLLAKIQTAISIIIDRDPKAVMSALIKKYDKTSALMNGLWKRNWKISGSKQVLKLFVFNLAKYGWAVGRTYPCILKQKKQVMTEYDAENPENNKYEERELVRYNDVKKQNLDPYRTWIDEMARPYDQSSRNECYYEIDYTYEEAKIEFESYNNFDFIGESAQFIDAENQTEEQKKHQEKERKDIITFGFYENVLKDKYIIYVPSKKIILYEGYLPNDDGLLSVWDSLWILRNANSPYGISLWKIIKGKKELYDKVSNMTMDQLVLSILKMFFYTGTSDLFADGKIKIKPGKGVQIQNGKVDWLEVPGPGKEAWEGLKYLKSGLDDDSGIGPTIEGEITGKTLGEILHAKEASLKRLKIPLENISWAIECDAYLTISWMKQIYSTPEIKSFADTREMLAYEKEMGAIHNELYGKLGETGEVEEYKASFYPELSLHLSDKGGQLYESKESQYFQMGKDIKLDNLHWKGMIEIVPTSILAPSEELEKQRKAELFNYLVPIIPGGPAFFKKPAIQLIKSRDEEPEDWLPEDWMIEEQPLFVQNPQQTPMQPPQAGQGQSLQAQQGMMPNQGAQKVIPQNQMPANMPTLGKIGGALERGLGLK